jgi:hypothetical protein
MKTCFVLLVSFLLSCCIHAQDPLFVQSHSNIMYLNPAFTGAYINPVINMSYRNQWPASSANFKTLFCILSSVRECTAWWCWILLSLRQC